MTETEVGATVKAVMLTDDMAVAPKPMTAAVATLAIAETEVGVAVKAVIAVDRAVEFAVAATVRA